MPLLASKAKKCKNNSLIVQLPPPPGGGDLPILTNMLQTNTQKNALAAIIAAAVIIIADQILKIWAKTHFYLGEGYEILPFLELRFVQNNGMAFGMEMGSKLLLSLFRIVVVGLLIWYIARLCKRDDKPRGYIITLAAIAAGAFGNIIDCVFYGCIFTDPYPPMVATMVPWGEGYGTLFHGLVVDMIHLPLFDFYWPDWMPWIGGDHFTFFDPVFNLADAAISVGIIVLIFRYAQCLPYQKEEQDDDQPQEADDNA